VNQLKVTEVWRKRFGQNVPLFDISTDDEKIIVYLNNFQTTGDNTLNTLVLLHRNGNIVKELPLNPSFSVSALKIVGGHIVCIGSKGAEYYYETYDFSLDLSASGTLNNIGKRFKVFIKNKDWYFFHFPTWSGESKKFLTCYKNGAMFWRKDMDLNEFRAVSSSDESRLVHIVKEKENLPQENEICILDFDGREAFTVKLQSRNEYPSCSSDNLTAIGEDDFDAKPSFLSVFDNHGNPLFKKQLRIEPHDVFISKKELVFVTLHSEYDSNVGGVIIFDKKGNEINHIDTCAWGLRSVQTKNGKAVAIPCGGKTLIFDENGQLVKIIENTMTFHQAAGASHILTKNETLSKDVTKIRPSELILIKIS